MRRVLLALSFSIIAQEAMEPFDQRRLHDGMDRYDGIGLAAFPDPPDSSWPEKPVRDDFREAVPGIALRFAIHR